MLPYQWEDLFAFANLLLCLMNSVELLLEIACLESVTIN